MMEKLILYEFNFLTSERKRGDEIIDIVNGKLYSENKGRYNEHDYLENILFSPPKSNGYSANMKLPKTDIKFYDFSVWDAAKQLDDFMESIEINPTFGFFISPRLKNILLEYRLPNHVLYPVNILFQNKVTKYFFMLISHENNGVDYKKSVFSNIQNDKITINQYIDLFDQEIDEQTNEQYWTEKGYLGKKIVFEQKMDIYSAITSSDAYFYFSEKLKKRLEEEEITGMSFYEAEAPEFYLTK